jgi:hypothetical protein
MGEQPTGVAVEDLPFGVLLRSASRLGLGELQSTSIRDPRDRPGKVFEGSCTPVYPVLLSR